MARSLDGKSKEINIHYPGETSLVLVVVGGVTLFVVVHCKGNGFVEEGGRGGKRWKVKVGEANKGRKKKSREEREAIAYIYTV
jgi:hypothetical protein